MSIFDIGSASASGLQSSATTVASSLVPKRHAATADLKSLGVDTLKANDSTATTPSTASTSSTDTSTITSSDFLTLLVSELKNQDPTQPTDPNAYITQLVGVNSLQQLISINQGISTIDSATTGTTSGTTPATGTTSTSATTP